MESKMIGIKKVAAMVGKSRSTVLRWVLSGSFPAPSKVITGRQYWTTEQVKTWMES